MDSYYNVIAWVLIMLGVVGIVLITALCFWLVIEEMNK